MTKEYPYINKFTGDIKILSKLEGIKLNEDWARAKMATNDKGDRVFRFKIASPVVGPDGKTVMGMAVVDISEVETKEVTDGNRSAE